MSTQIERISYIVDRICDPVIQYIRKNDVAREMDVTTRQVTRDLEYLRTVGFPDLGPVDLVYNEQHRRHEPTEDTLERIVKWRIRRAGVAAEHGLNDRDLSVIRLDSKYIIHKSYAKEYFNPKVYTLLMKAIQQHLIVSFRSGRKEPHVVEPLRLVKYGELWYLYAVYHVSRSRGIYTFNLSRITDLREEGPCDREWEPEMEEKLEDIKDAYGIWYGRDKARTYKIRFSGWAADSVDAQEWQKDQIIEWSEDMTELTLTLRVRSHQELIGRILFYGACAEPLEPQDFVDEYWAKVREMAAKLPEAAAEDEE